MIIGPQFVWLHFPKCAGTFTEKLLRIIAPKNAGIEFDPIDQSKMIWHHNIVLRESYSGVSLSGKDIICNFRRLPSWMIRRTQFELHRTGQEVTHEMLIQGKFLEQSGKINHADVYLKKYTNRPVKHWIRAEQLSVDIVRVFSNYFEIDPEFVRQYSIKKVNAGNWDGDVSKWFTKSDLETLYKACPTWASLEKQLYGNLMIDLL